MGERHEEGDPAGREKVSATSVRNSERGGTTTVVDIMEPCGEEGTGRVVNAGFASMESIPGRGQDANDDGRSPVPTLPIPDTTEDIVALPPAAAAAAAAAVCEAVTCGAPDVETPALGKPAVESGNGPCTGGADTPPIHETRRSSSLPVRPPDPSTPGCGWTTHMSPPGGRDGTDACADDLPAPLEGP